MNKLISVLKYLIGWPLTIISFAFIAKIIISNLSIFSQIKGFDPLIFLLSVFVFLLYLLFRALIWKEMLDITGNKLSLKETVFIWSSTEIKRYIPGNIWSFVSRAEDYKLKGIERKNVYKSFILEIELIILSCSLISLQALSYVLNDNLLKILIYCLVIIITILFIVINGFNKILVINNKIITLFFPKINFLIKIKLLIYSLISFTFFGIATYLAGYSIIYLNPYYLQGYIGFFVFSLLAGYLSFITPMGLGVREGFMTLSLSRFMNLQFAGIFAIFTRIMFIISEIIFLIIAFSWHNIKSKMLTNIELFIGRHKYEISLILLTIVYFSYFTFASFLRYDNFFTGRFDLGNMDQTVWNTIHGRLFQMTDPNGTAVISRLAFHADFILILASPLYLIWAHPKMLLILQTFILSLGSIFIYLISQEITKNRKFSFTISLTYLFYPPLMYANLYDFHGVTLATSFLLITFYFLLKKRFFFFTVFAAISAICKEEIWLIIALFGIAIAVREYFISKFKNLKTITFGGIVFTSSCFIFYLLIWKIIPQFRGQEHFALSFYSDFGSSASGIIANIILNPFKTFFTVVNSNNFIYIIELLGSVGFLPLSFPFAMVFALPDFAINLLSKNAGFHQIYYQYTSAITPFIFISTIYSSVFLTSKFKKVTFENLSLYVLCMALIFQYLLGPLPFTKHPSMEIFFNQLPYRKEINDYLGLIPKEYSIAATNNLGSHLSRREKIFTIPVGVQEADVILFLLNDPFAQPSLAAQKEMVKKLQKDKDYIEIYKKGDFIVFEKKSLYSVTKPKKGEETLFPFSIIALSHRSYTKSEITFEKQIKSKIGVRAFIISFTSDGLKQYALLETPDKQPPKGGFPVIIINHGYIQPDIYSTEDSYRQIADYFSQNGYMVLKPDYRGNGQSEVLDTTHLRFSYPIDVINLIETVENIKDADIDNISIWGHSMGGEVTLKVLEIISSNENINSKIKSAVLWAPVTDPVKWFSLSHVRTLPEAKLTPFPYSKTFQAIGTPEENPQIWRSLSPLNYLNSIKAPILIQHGTSDTTVPYQWSEELNYSLKNLNKNVRFISYPNDNHNFPKSWTTAANDDLTFFNNFISK